MFVKLDAGSFLVFIEVVLNKYSTKLASTNKGKATRWLARMPNGACSLRESLLRIKIDWALHCCKMCTRMEAIQIQLYIASVEGAGMFRAYLLPEARAAWSLRTGAADASFLLISRRNLTSLTRMSTQLTCSFTRRTALTVGPDGSVEGASRHRGAADSVRGRTGLRPVIPRVPFRLGSSTDRALGSTLIVGGGTPGPMWARAARVAVTLLAPTVPVKPGWIVLNGASHGQGPRVFSSWRSRMVFSPPSMFRQRDHWDSVGVVQRSLGRNEQPED